MRKTRGAVPQRVPGLGTRDVFVSETQRFGDAVGHRGLRKFDDAHQRFAREKIDAAVQRVACPRCVIGILTIGNGQG